MDPQGGLHCEWPQAQELLIQKGQRIEPSRSFLPPAASPDWHGISPENLAGVTPCPLPAPPSEQPPCRDRSSCLGPTWALSLSSWGDGNGAGSSPAGGFVPGELL